MTPYRKELLLSNSFSALLAFAMLGVFGGELRFWDSDGVVIVPGFLWKLSLVLAAFVAISRKFTRQVRDTVSQLTEPKPQIISGWFVLALLVLLLSDYWGRGFIFYVPDFKRMYFVWAAAMLLPVFLAQRAVISVKAFWAVQLLLACCFIRYADGRLLFSDDHPSFLYRLQLLKENFPNIPFYNPAWNAGYSAREFFATGALNLFFLSLPIISAVSDFNSYSGATVYTLLIPYLFILIIPWCVYWAAKELRFGSDVAAVSAILSLGPTLTFFEWLLSYGTMGCCISIGLFPLVFAVGYRLFLIDEKVSWLRMALLLVTSSLTAMWSLSSVAFVPLGVVVVISLFRAGGISRLSRLAVFLLLFFAVNGGWIATFVRESKVVQFVSGSQLPGTHEKHAAPAQELQFGKKARELLAGINPLVFFLFIPGLCAVRERRLQLLLLATVAWLAVVAVAGLWIKPQLELKRMMLFAVFGMTIIAGAAIAKLMEPGKHWGHRASSLIVAAMLLLTPINVGAIYLNLSSHKFVFASAAVERLSRAIAEHEGDGRVFFLGFILHELGDDNPRIGGHIAPLAAFTGRELYAAEPYHASWRAHDPIPEEFRTRGAEGIEEFLDLVNATAVISFTREWAEYCKTQPGYREVVQVGRFRLFSRKGSAQGFFLRGEGQVAAGKSNIVLRNVHSEAVIKYRYLPGLKVSPAEAGRIEPVEVFAELNPKLGKMPVSFIRFIPNSNYSGEVRIGF